MVEFERGELTQAVYPKLLLDIFRGRATGMLSLRSPGERKFLFFEKGEIHFAQSSLPGEQLGSLMLRAGVFDDQVYGRVVDLVRDKGWLNPALYEENLITEQTMKFWVKALIREVVLSIFKWQHGEYRFFHGKLPPRTTATANVNTEKLVITSVLRLRDVETLVGVLGNLDDVPKINNDMFVGTQVDLTPENAFFLSRIDGSLSFRQILSIAGSQRMEMLRFYIEALLRQLILTGPPIPIIRYKPPEKPAASEVIPEPESAEASPEPEEIRVEVSAPDRGFYDDVELTADELLAISQLGKSLHASGYDVHQKYSRDQQKKDAVDLDAKLSYLRDGEFIEADDDTDGAVDIEALKREAELAQQIQEDEEGLKFVVGGQVVDAEADLFGKSKHKDFFATQDAEDQWNNWLRIEVDETDADFLDDWEKAWKEWEDHQREIRRLEDSKERIKNKLRQTTDPAMRKRLIEQLQLADHHIQRLIEQKKREIIHAYRRSQVQSYYELFRISEDADNDQIKEAYFDWLKEYQPDKKYLDHFEAMVEPLAKLVDMLHKAYEVLSDPFERAEYDEALAKRKAHSEAIQKKKQMLAKDHLASGKAALKRNDSMLAMRFLRGSISLDPRNPIYFEEMADLLAKNKKWLKEAFLYYHRAFHLDRENPGLLVKVAEVAIQLHQPEFAEKALQQALQLAPDNVHAKQMLNSIRNMYT